jgi:hypothetical protein
VERWPHSSIPDGISPIVGYRLWTYTISPGRVNLHSQNCGSNLPTSVCPWEMVGTQWRVASCLRGEEHLVPDENCSCGFYAMRELPWLLAQAPVPASALGIPGLDDGDEGSVLGRVELAGKVIEHEYGYRAERGRIAEFIPFQGSEEDVARLATEWGLPMRDPVAVLPERPVVIFSVDSVKWVLDRRATKPKASRARVSRLLSRHSGHGPPSAA